MALDALMVVHNPRRKKRRFSAKQIAAQRLFAKRARSGRWRRNARIGHARPAGKPTRSFRTHFGAAGPKLWGRTSKARRRRSSTKYSALLHEHQLVSKRKNPRRRKRGAKRSNPMRRNYRGRPKKHSSGAKKAWRKHGRKMRAAAMRNLRKAWAKRRRRKGGSSRPKRRRHVRRHRKSLRHVRAGRIGAARRRARKSGYTGPMWLNPRRRRGRKSRRYGRRRARRNLYVVTNRRRRSRRRARRNPGFGIFNPRRWFRRRGHRRNPNVRGALWGLVGFGAVRAIPAIVARFAPGVVASIASIAPAGWGDVALSGAALALMYVFGSRIPVVGGALTSPIVLLGASMSVALDVLQRVAPPNLLMAFGLAPSGGMVVTPAPGVAGWSPDYRTGSINGYVQTPMLAGYVQTPMLGAYVQEAAMGADVRQQLMGLGVDVTTPGPGACPGCVSLPARNLSVMARMAAAGIPGTTTREVPLPGGINVPGIFGGSIFTS